MAAGRPERAAASDVAAPACLADLPRRVGRWLERSRGRPRELALGMAFGVFAGTLPVIPFQTFVAVALSSAPGVVLGAAAGRPAYFVSWAAFRQLRSRVSGGSPA